MPETNRHDAWAAADSYEAYMGRWSRPVAARFIDWLGMPAGQDWLDVGCGTGSLSAAINSRTNPRSVIAIDPSEGFLAKARADLGHTLTDFRQGDAASLATMEAASRDVVASALVLNFVPDKVAALAQMKRIARPGGTVAFYVWDYPGGGVEFMRAFWNAATELDPGAAELTESRRFPFCTPEGLSGLMGEAGLRIADRSALESPCLFKDFDDYWRPFTLGTGPAPGYCASLDPEASERLRQKLEADLPRLADGTIALKTRAWAFRAVV